MGVTETSLRGKLLIFTLSQAEGKAYKLLVSGIFKQARDNWSTNYFHQFEY